MVRRPECPAPAEYQNTLNGLTPDEEIERLASHLEGCSRCTEVLGRLERQDGLVAAVRDLKDALQAEEELPGELLQRFPGYLSFCRGPASRNPSAAESDVGFLAPAQGPDEIGRLGPFRVLTVLGQGGMGIVFLAEDTQLKRQVALKVMKPALASGSATARDRFLREARLAAATRHEHIVTIFQVGEDRGVPFLAMEYLEGRSLEDLLETSGPLLPDQVLRVGHQVALGLAAAHERGLIHRDIKPENIWLVSPGDQVKLLDFGLARAADDDVRMTRDGAILGTPAYMAPEQAEGLPADQRADLFALGCVLYRLATGRPSFPGRTVPAVLAAVVRDNPRPPREINPAIPQALDALITRLLAKNPEERPQTARAVAEALQDIRGRLAVETTAQLPASPPPVPVEGLVQRNGSAGPGGAGPAELAPAAPVRGRPGRRWRGWCAAALVLLAGLGAAGTWYGPTVVRWVTNRGVVIIETDARVEVTIKGQTARIFDPGSKRELELHAGEHEVEVRELPEGLRVFTRRFTLEAGGREILDVRAELAGLEPRRRPEEKQPGGRAPGGPPLGPVALVARPARVPGAQSWTIETRGHRGPAAAVAFSPDGRWLATGGAADGTIRLWDVEAGKLVRVMATQVSVRQLAWSPDGKTLAAGDDYQPLQLWDPFAGRVARPLPVGPCSGLAWSPDGHLLAVLGGQTSVWDVGRGKAVVTLPTSARRLSWSPDGSMLAIGGEPPNNQVELWAIPAGKKVLTFPDRPRPGWIEALAWSPDGKTLASGDLEGGICLWDARTGQLRDTAGPKKTCVALAWSPDGRRLLSSHLDEVLLWDVQAKRVEQKLPQEELCDAIAFSPDGKAAAYGQRDGQVRVINVPSGEPRHVLQGYAFKVADNRQAVAWSPDGRLIASGERHRRDNRWYGAVRVWDVRSGETLHLLWGYTVPLAWSADGKTLAAGVDSETTVLLDAASGKAWGKLGGHSPEMLAAAWSPDGKHLATAGRDGTGKIWQAAERKLLHTLKHPGIVTHVVWSPDGKLLATAGQADPRVRVWEADSGKMLQALPVAPEGYPFSPHMAWSPDGGTLVTGGSDLRLWDARAGENTYTERLPPPAVRALVWLADGKTLTVVHNQEKVSFWDAAARRIVRQYQQRSSPEEYPLAGIAPDRRTVAAAQEGAVLLWQLDSGRRLGRLVLFDVARYLVVSPEGHYRWFGDPEQDLVHVVQTAEGQEMMTPRQFATTFGWENKPEHARLTETVRPLEE